MMLEQIMADLRVLDRIGRMHNDSCVVGNYLTYFEPARWQTADIIHGAEEAWRKTVDYCKGGGYEVPVRQEVIING